MGSIDILDVNLFLLLYINNKHARITTTHTTIATRILVSILLWDINGLSFLEPKSKVGEIEILYGNLIGLDDRVLLNCGNADA
jgi:hypothetical protein